MTALILALAAVATSIVLAWLTVRDVDALPKMWRRIKLVALAAALLIGEAFELEPDTLERLDSTPWWNRVNPQHVRARMAELLLEQAVAARDSNASDHILRIAADVELGNPVCAGLDVIYGKVSIVAQEFSRSTERRYCDEVAAIIEAA